MESLKQIMPIYSDVEFREKKRVENSICQEKFGISDLVVVMSASLATGSVHCKLVERKDKKETTYFFKTRGCAG